MGSTGIIPYLISSLLVTWLIWSYQWMSEWDVGGGHRKWVSHRVPWWAWTWAFVWQANTLTMVPPHHLVGTEALVQARIARKVKLIYVWNKYTHRNLSNEQWLYKDLFDFRWSWSFWVNLQGTEVEIHETIPSSLGLQFLITTNRYWLSQTAILLWTKLHILSYFSYFRNLNSFNVTFFSLGKWTCTYFYL